MDYDDENDRITAFFNHCMSGRDSHRAAFSALEQKLSSELGLNIRLDIFTEQTAKAFNEQWKPILDEDEDLRRDRYLSAMSIESEFYCKKAGENLSRVFNDGYDPFHFKLAIWVDDELCGLAKGGHSAETERDYISVHVMEGSPRKDHPLKGQIARIIDEASIAYAEQIGVSKIARMGPYSDGAKNYHENNGMELEAITFNKDGMKSRAYVRNI